MLTQLSIQNYALIDQLSVSFNGGFSIITGETGAGKSILLGGLGLILGKRADISAINDESKKCIVEASFNIENYSLKKWFAQEELDYDDETIIRREILPSGKSRAFINDSPVSLQILKRLSERLIDIHSQHQTLQLTDNQFQFEVVDALAKNDKLLGQYSDIFKELKKEKQHLLELITSQESANKEADYNRFLLEELLEAQLEQFSIEELEKELEQLSNVEFIQEKLLLANQLLSDEQMGLSSLLIQLKNNIKELSVFSENYQKIFERVESTYIELDDVFAEVEAEQERIEANPARLQEVKDSIDKLNSLLQKHQVDSLVDLIKIREELDVKVVQLDNLSGTIQQKENLINELTQDLNELAAQIRNKRNEAIPKLVQQLEKIVKNLGMENAKFNIQLTNSDVFLRNGKDNLQFLFSANKGGSFNELKKSASGGELSRIMLAIKAVLSKYKKMPTIMFDEIDTGVSGDVADKMGLLMQYMSDNMQVFSITHLPQIASKGNQHFKVYKKEVTGITRSNLKELNFEERVNEIAEMLGGKELTDTALSHAKELLKV